MLKVAKVHLRVTLLPFFYFTPFTLKYFLCEDLYGHKYFILKKFVDIFVSIYVLKMSPFQECNKCVKIKVIIYDFK